MKITKRDVRMFLLGMVTLLLLEIVFDWNNTIGDFVKGFNEGYKTVRE